jgi:hypothetical protein
MPYPLPIAPDGVDADAWAAVVADVRGVCGWHIAPEVTETLTVDGPNSSVLILPTLRLVDVVSVLNDGTAVVDPEWSTSGMVRTYCWTWKYRGVVAEITHGFEEWPEDLLAAMYEMATRPQDPSVESYTTVAGPFTNTERYSKGSLREDARVHRYALPEGLA